MRVETLLAADLVVAVDLVEAVRAKAIDLSGGGKVGGRFGMWPKVATAHADRVKAKVEASG